MFALLRSYELRPHALGIMALLLANAAVKFWPDANVPVIEACARFLSGIGNSFFLVAGYSLLLFMGIRTRRQGDAWLALLVCVCVTILVHAVKMLSFASLLRPSGSYAGYPSGHAAAAFALAFLLSCKYPRLAGVWYTVAAGISWSRVAVEAHYPYQVYAGSTLGYLLAVFLHERVKPSKALWRLAYHTQFILITLVATSAIFTTLHEYENDLVLFSFGGVFFNFGMLIRIWSRQHTLSASRNGEAFCSSGPFALMRHPTLAANTLICIGVTIASEIIWLLPLAVMTCMIVYSLVAKGREDKLSERFGPDYQRYLDDIPRWVPKRAHYGYTKPCSSELWPAVKCEMVSVLLVLPVIVKEVLHKPLSF